MFDTEECFINLCFLLYMEFYTHILPNGIRLVHKQTDSDVAHVGLTVNTGSRDEDDDENGMSHFIEHMIFKGTKKRKAFHLLSRMEDVGGEINAYTTKEETCVHSSFFAEHYDRALEVISDLAFNSVFPIKEIEKEKDVIIDEINSYKDSPAELIYDEFEEFVFKDISIGKNILGTEESIKSINRGKIINFLSKNYLTTEMVISSVGNINFDKLCKLFEKYYNTLSFKDKPVKKTIDIDYVPFNKSFAKNTHQVHCIIGSTAYTIKDEKRYSLFLLNNLLGGPGLNSRLNLSLREKNGYAYNVDSMYTPYTDTGTITIYFSSDKSSLNKSLNLVYKEMDKLRNEPLGKNQLIKAKRQLLGQIAISSENNENLMLSMGKGLLLFNHIHTLDDIKEKVESITIEQLNDVANEIFKEDKISQLIFC